MPDTQGGDDGKLSVNFEEVTEIFRNLQPIAKRAVSAADFAKLIQERAAGPIYDKYFDKSVQNKYRREELDSLVEHVMSCINNIIPPHIPYRSAQDEEGRWVMAPKSRKDPPESKPN